MKRSPKKTVKKEISDAFCEEIKKRLVEGKRIRRRLPYEGWLNIDRNLPFLFVYRRPTRKRDEGTQKLVKGEASYLIVSGVTRLRKSLKKLIHNIVETQTKQFNAFLIIELWSNDVIEKNESIPDLRGPEFRIITSTTRPPVHTVEALQEALNRIMVNRRTSSVKILFNRNRSPEGLNPLISIHDARVLNCFVIGLEVSSMYRNRNTGELYPLALRRLHLGLSGALKIAAFTFANHQTNLRPKHFQALGKRALVKSVWEVDRQLADLDSMFNFLLLVTPVNVEQAWSLFKKSHFEKVPEFYYRLRPIDPALLKRQLYRIPIESIEDPLIATMLRDKRTEINRKLTMLEDRNLPQFFYGSLQLYGGVNDEFKLLAEKLLKKIKPHIHNGKKKEFVGAEEFAKRVFYEFENYKVQFPEMAAKVEIRDDIVGLMVVSGNLLISRDVSIPKSRVEALVQHEIGTHVLTYYNGKSQPFRQLFCGLPGYEELQEGLAVLAEYLVGGLSGPRLRLLAGRVIASHLLIENASFMDTFQELNKSYGFNKRTSFIITVRTYRGGGLTKDAIYLRGLVRLMNYLKNGGDLDTLFIGKIALEHVSVIQELQWRSVLHEAPLQPSYMLHEDITKKISKLRNKTSILDLI